MNTSSKLTKKLLSENVNVSSMENEGNEKCQSTFPDYLNMSSIYGSVTYVSHDLPVDSQSVKVIFCKRSEMCSSLAEAYLEPCKASKMERFAKIVNN